METIMGLVHQSPDYIHAATALIVGANSLTMLTPTTVDNSVCNILLKILNFLSMNVLKNKNADS